MKTKLLFLALCSAFILYSCHKDDIADISMYENLLNTDYGNALKSHESLLDSTVSSGFKQAYFNKMFGESDSLFSEHFYKFCRELVESDESGMIRSSGMRGMRMMDHAGMMDHDFDAYEMMNYIDSIHIMQADRMQLDSLIFGQMERCNMMTSRTENIKSTFSNMQLLRRQHGHLHFN